MWLLIVSCLLFLIPNFSMEKINNEQINNFYLKTQCHTIGDKCNGNNDCCSQLTCYSIQSMFFFYFIK